MDSVLYGVCKELNEELQIGVGATVALAKHLQAMNAARMTSPVILDGIEYEVKVERKGWCGSTSNYAVPIEEQPKP